MKLEIKIKKIIYKKDTTLITECKILKAETLNVLESNIFLFNTLLNTEVEDEFFVEGEYKLTKKGYTFYVESLERSVTKDLKVVKNYLINIGNVGNATANKIIDAYKIESIQKIEESLDNLLNIKITKKKALEIRQNILANKEKEQLVIYLSKYFKTKNIFSFLDKNILEIKENPFLLMENNYNLFKICLKMYADLKLNNKELLNKYSLIYKLNKDTENGNLFMYLNNFTEDEQIILKKEEEFFIEDERAYLKLNKYTEKRIVELLKERISNFEEFDTQEEAIKMALKNDFSILTGGPGTGKTYVINQIIKNYSKEILLMAPTGKAVNRLKELTGKDAYTIHRKLHIFENEEECDFVEIEEDFVIVDESSMIDAYLFLELLKATEGKKLLLVGDYNQLPSVGPGLILRDLIDSKKITTTKLNKIFRQESGNIINNAKNVLEGKEIIINNADKANDFYFIETSSIEDVVLKSVNNLINNKKVNLDNIQILTPTKKSISGTINLNNKIQNIFNKNTQFTSFKNKLFKKGDNVLQTVNNYEKNVFNGDIGKVIECSENELKVEFMDEIKIYLEDEIDELELSYAITVHKSQGSEFDYVILVLDKEHNFINNKNLIYTAITRAKKMCVIVGSLQELNIIIKKEISERNSNIKNILINTF